MMMTHDYIAFSYWSGAYLLVIYKGEAVARGGLSGGFKEDAYDEG